MSTAAALPMEACKAYEALADGYDVLTGGYDHARWLHNLEALAKKHGLQGNRLLDVACGTGASFLPLLARGYRVTACDISARMLSHARRKAPDAVLHLADMRELPRLGTFDLITCIDDAVNYILDERELELVLGGFARNLAPDGLALWDLNTLAQYRGQFARDHVVERDGFYVGWRSKPGGTDAARGEIVEIALDVFSCAEDGRWQRSAGVHRQRHWPRSTVERRCRAAGLELLEVRGQFAGATQGENLDEEVHVKAIYLARLERGVT